MKESSDCSSSDFYFLRSAAVRFDPAKLVLSCIFRPCDCALLEVCELRKVLVEGGGRFFGGRPRARGVGVVGVALSEYDSADCEDLAAALDCFFFIWREGVSLQK